MHSAQWQSTFQRKTLTNYKCINIFDGVTKGNNVLALKYINALYTEVEVNGEMD